MRTWLLVCACVLAMLGPARADEPAPASERVALASEAYVLFSDQLKSGRESVETVYQWSVRWLDAGRDAAAGPKDVAAALNAHLERMQALETTAKAMVSAGAASRGTQVAASYFRAEAEAWAGKSKKPAPHKKKP